MGDSAVDRRPFRGALAGDGGAEAAASPRRGWPAAWFLLAIAGLALFPSFLISTLLLREIAADGAIQRERALRAEADLKLQAIDRQLRESIVVLRVLATSDALAAGDFAQLHRRLQRALQDEASHILVLDRELRQIINTRVPYGTPLGRTSDPASSRAAAERRGPYISTVFFGKVAQAQVFNVVLPVFDASGPRHYLIMTRDADSLVPLLDRSAESDTGALLVDQKGQLVARSSGTEGAAAAAILARAADATPTGTAVATVAVDRDEYAYATARSPFSGWRIISYVPREQFEASLDRSMTLLTSVSFAILLACMAAAAWVSRRMTQPLEALAAAARGATGAVLPLRSSIREINDAAAALARAAEEREARSRHLDLLLREMAHRVRNQFAVIEAIFRQTQKATQSDEEFRRAFVGRLHGLSRSAGALAEGGWGAAPLRDLVHAHVEPFATPGVSPVVVDGGPVRLTARAAETLGLALHELATNSLKYGVLSKGEGRVEITWSLDGAAFRFAWREQGSAPTPPPERKGFGSLVLERIAAQQLHGTASLHHTTTGLTWSLQCPRDRVVDAEGT